MTAKTDNLQIVMWPIDRLVDHPDNPRTINTGSQKFKDLQASIAANGIIEPLTVREIKDCREGLQLAREAMGVSFLQVLSGHRRLMAAKVCGLTEVPVRNLGRIADELAFDIVAMANLHEELTPLEEGRRAAIWLDKYHEDVVAVAAKLGKSPHWVMIHAQIHRGLSADWRKAIEDRSAWEPESYWIRMVDHWTAEHWARIARLPARAQAEKLGKFQKDYRYFDADQWSVKRLEEQLQIDLLYLAKAPFPTGEGTQCHDCLSRTGVQPLLFGEVAEDATGGKERCLEPKCWQRRCDKVSRELFKKTAAESGHPEAVPLSLLEPPKDRWGSAWAVYKKRTSALRRAVRGTLTVEDVKIVKEGTKGAVPAVIVAGKGKGLRWVKREEWRGNGRGVPRPPSPAELAEQAAQKEEKNRWEKVLRAAWKEISKAPRPDDTVVLICCTRATTWPDDRDDRGKFAKELLSLHDGGQSAEAICHRFLEEAWLAFVQAAGHRSTYAWQDQDRPVVADLGRFFGINLEQRYAEVQAKEKKKGEGKAGVCRVCGCTDKDCSQCIAVTGEPCHWVEADLCSRCAAEATKAQPAKPKRERARKAAAPTAGVAVCSSDCHNCSQPNCNGRQTEFASQA